MSIHFTSEVLEAMAPYYKVVKDADPSLSSMQLMFAANVLRDLEADPENPVDYKSISIAINEAKVCG